VGRRRAGAAAGRDETVGYGAVEIDLATGKAAQHRPPDPREGEAAKADILTLPPALTGLYFDRQGQDLWFASLSGVNRWTGGELRSWGEADGMPSELVHGVGKGPDGTIWAATSEGPASFDGKVWRAARAGETLATRALVHDGGGRTWLATAKGLRMIPSAGVESIVVDGDMRDVVLDRFGRLWALSNFSIARVEAP
jgi:ligand-binding sensor domain-containing protein